MLSPSEQTKAKSLVLLILLVVLVLAAALAAYLWSQSANLREYRLYFTEDRKPAQLSLLELNESWTEASLRQRFAGHPVVCVPYRGELPAQRACAVYVSSLNDVSTLFVSFFFAQGSLRHVSVNVPWWAHKTARRSLIASFGPPIASPFLPYSGVRLHGWSLVNGSAVFLNRDLPLNPLSWNGIHWRSASSCANQGCFKKNEHSRELTPY